MHGYSHLQGLRQGFPWEDKVLLHGLEDVLLVLGLQWKCEKNLYHCVLQVLDDFLLVLGLQWPHHLCLLLTTGISPSKIQRVKSQHVIFGSHSDSSAKLSICVS